MMSDNYPLTPDYSKWKKIKGRIGARITHPLYPRTWRVNMVFSHLIKNSDQVIVFEKVPSSFGVAGDLIVRCGSFDYFLWDHNHWSAWLSCGTVVDFITGEEIVGWDDSSPTSKDRAAFLKILQSTKRTNDRSVANFPKDRHRSLEGRRWSGNINGETLQRTLEESIDPKKNFWKIMQDSS